MMMIILKLHYTHTNRHHKLLIKQNQQTIPEFVEEKNDEDDDHDVEVENCYRLQ